MIFTDKFALSQSDARISVASNSVAISENHLQDAWWNGPLVLKLLFIDYKYGWIWYQFEGNDMRIIITLSHNLKQTESGEISNQKLLKIPLKICREYVP